MLFIIKQGSHLAEETGEFMVIRQIYGNSPNLPMFPPSRVFLYMVWVDKIKWLIQQKVKLIKRSRSKAVAS